MVTALIVYLACAFGADGAPRFGVFDSAEACSQAVAQVRQSGLFASDCIRVEIPKPRNGSSS
jgi:hypothetical protein